MNLMQALLASRAVTQLTQIQPTKGTVDKVFYKAGAIARPPGYARGVDINANMDMLTGPVWGATTPDAFITISGIPPQSPVVGQVAPTLGSNAPTGGNC